VRDLVLYDGGCGLCHRSVSYLARRDRDGSRFRFAPLGGETAGARLAQPDAGGFPAGTVVVLTADGRVLLRSDAALHALGRLGGGWRALAAAFRAVPRPLRDAVYRLVARLRRRLFPPPSGACPRLPAGLAARFLP
jgi:predicted DCC family thiol-disulfide oxidoreductase YuxK